MHTYTFLKMRKRSVTCGAFLMLCSWFIVKKKETPLKRILDGSRKFQTPHRLIKNGSTKNKNKGLLCRPKRSPLFFIFSAAKQFLAMGSWTPQSVLFNPVGHTSFTRRETSKCAFLFFSLAEHKEFCLQSILCYTSLLILGETFKKNIDRQKILR